MPTFRMSICSLRTNIRWSNWSSGWCVNFRYLWTDHQCCGNTNSKPSFSTNLRPISIQHSIRCTRDQCRHGECWFSENEHNPDNDSYTKVNVIALVFLDSPVFGIPLIKINGNNTNIPYDHQKTNYDWCWLNWVWGIFTYTIYGSTITISISIDL